MNIKVAIVDYGFGNTGSIANMLKKIGILNVIVTKDENEIMSSSHLILPGVGRFDNAMRTLIGLNLNDVINRFVSLNRPLLGICLGMQLLSNFSEEGNVNGLGLIDFTVKRFPSSNTRKVPHMGTNTTKTTLLHELHKGLDEPRFYFVHSYYATEVKTENVLFITNYKDFEFVSGVYKSNVYGVQFHPEKSHRFGMQFLKNFVELTV
jgi:imidazole glycerol-phosphate synthase subunit HisH